jgi:hypothetical protein
MTSVGDLAEQFLSRHRGRARADAIAAADIAVQAALIEYMFLREEGLQLRRQIMTTSTLGLAVVGGVASLIAGLLAQDNWRYTVGDEAAVLAVAIVAIVILAVAVVSMEVHVRTIDVWLRYVSEHQVKAVLEKAAGPTIDIPARLLGWPAYSSRQADSPGWGLLRGFVWFVLLPLPLAAAVFWSRLFADWWYYGNWLYGGTEVLMLLDVAVTAVALAYVLFAFREFRRLRIKIATGSL